MAWMKPLILVASLILSADALSCPPECEEGWCAVVQCADGAEHVKDICGCCDVCPGVTGDGCGGWYDVDCGKDLICAGPLPEIPDPNVPKFEIVGGWESSGKCQDPKDVHKCQLSENADICGFHGTCVPDGRLSPADDGYTCICQPGWTGKSCEDKEIMIEPQRPHLVGGFGRWQEATDEVQKVANQVQGDVEQMDNMGPFKMFNAVKYKSQVVSGTNYRIKVDVGEETYLMVVVYEHWSGTLSLSKAKFTKELIPPPEDPIIGIVCDANQEFTTCGTACENICGEPAPFICTMQCVVGCQCPSGWWKNPDGSCVEDESQCEDLPKPLCEFNKEWNDCGTACPKICGEPEPLFCTMQCEIGCQCPHGWWETSDGSCVEDDSQCEDLPLVDPDCQDNHDSCESWAESGECCSNPGYMLDNCAAACGQCGSNPDLSCKCEDKNDQCEQWASEGECCSNEEYMLENCKESCAQCGEVRPVPGCPCMNHDQNCDDWAEAGECEKNPGFMKTSCEKACGECSIAPPLPPVFFDACASNPCDDGCFCDNEPSAQDGYYCACPIVDPIWPEEEPEEVYEAVGVPLYHDPEEMPGTGR